MIFSMRSIMQTCLPDGGVNSFNLLNPNFGNIASTINGNRQIKFWLKYSF